MGDRYVVEFHGGYGNHKSWRVKRQYDGCIICVCVYKRGANRACAELNALASCKMGVNCDMDQYAK